MTLKSIALAGATLLALAAPAAAMAQPSWDHERGYSDRGYNDRDDWRWRDHERREYRHGYSYAYGQRCFIENRGYRNWRGEYVRHQVRVCR